MPGAAIWSIPDERWALGYRGKQTWLTNSELNVERRLSGIFLKTKRFSSYPQFHAQISW